MTNRRGRRIRQRRNKRRIAFHRAVRTLAAGLVSCIPEARPWFRFKP
jgi:hypothetical protein